jgi:hypothetical protein
MPFRGDIKIIDAFKSGRVFFTLLFSFVILDEVNISKSSIWIKKVIISISIYYTIMVLLNIGFPNIVNKIFIGGSSMVTENAWGFEDETRYVIKGNPGILFIHLGFIIKFFEYYSFSIKKNKDILFLSFLFIGIVLQGWRAPLFSIIITSIFVFSINTTHIKVIKVLRIIFFAITILFVVEYFVKSNFFTNKLISAYNEISGNDIGSFKGRLERAKIYQIPMFLESKWIGYGFVHKSSGLAMKLGNLGERPYNLYDFDFGYITLLNYFGIIGTIFFLFLFFYMLKDAYKAVKNENNNLWLRVMLTFLLSLLLINYSFGGLESQLGLLPLSIVIGLAQWQCFLGDKI